MRKINSSNDEDTKLLIKSIMKKIIRTAFALVMERDNSWTVDLDEMTKIFSKYYPQKSNR